jgi:hypothetical protein
VESDSTSDIEVWEENILMKEMFSDSQNLDLWIRKHYGPWIDEEVNRLRKLVEDSPTFLEKYSLPIKLSRKVNKETLLMIFLLVTYFPEDLRSTITLSLMELVKEPSFQSYFRTDERQIKYVYKVTCGSSQKRSELNYYFLYNLLNLDRNGVLFMHYLEKTNGKRWFFGNVFQQVDLRGVHLNFSRKIEKKPKYVQRKRGYSDKGSKRDSTTTMPGPDVVTDAEANVLRMHRQNLHEEIRLSLAEYCAEAGFPTQLNLERKEFEKLWKIKLLRKS